MNITTNNHPRELVAFHQLPKEQWPDFDYIGEEGQFSQRFFKYRGQWYDVGEFVRLVPMSAPSPQGFEHRVPDDSPLLLWDAIQTDSFFSAVVIRFTDDHEQIVVGFCYS